MCLLYLTIHWLCANHEIQASDLGFMMRQKWKTWYFCSEQNTAYNVFTIADFCICGTSCILIWVLNVLCSWGSQIYYQTWVWSLPGLVRKWLTDWFYRDLINTTLPTTCLFWCWCWSWGCWQLVQECTIDIVMTAHRGFVSSLMTAQSQIGNRFTVCRRNGHSLMDSFWQPGDSLKLKAAYLETNDCFHSKVH